ncbi:NADAR domain-containing protein [Streptosporangium soli]
MVRCSIAKFGRDPDLKRFLLATGRRVLVEASPRDRIWGSAWPPLMSMPHPFDLGLFRSDGCP